MNGQLPARIFQLGGVHAGVRQERLHDTEVRHARAVERHVKRRPPLAVHVEKRRRSGLDETAQRPFKRAHLQRVMDRKVRPEPRGDEGAELIREIARVIPLGKQHVEWIVAIVIASVNKLPDG